MFQLFISTYTSSFWILSTIDSSPKAPVIEQYKTNNKAEHWTSDLLALFEKKTIV